MGAYAKRVSEVIKDNASNLAIKEGRPRVYLNSSRDSKEGIARKIMEEDKIQEGLIPINNPREFKIYRKVERCGKKVMRWIPVGKSVFNAD